MRHNPVLLQQAIERLNVKKGGLYIDATFGEGGYSYEVVKRGGIVLGIDLDINQLKSLAGLRVSKLTSLKLVQGNFADIEKIAKDNDFYPVDGVIFDLGLSMRQIDESGRGFSYKKDSEVLDMRINLDQELKAVDLIKKNSEEKLAQIFVKYSEEIKSREIAKEIKKAKKIITVFDLKKAIDKALGYKSEKTYARIFQALRIAVNNEFENLKKGLEGAVKITKKGGRIVVVAFHSLEDRIVKNFVREKKLSFLDKKPIFGAFSYERSAKLRTILI